MGCNSSKQVEVQAQEDAPPPRVTEIEKIKEVKHDPERLMRRVSSQVSSIGDGESVRITERVELDFQKVMESSMGNAALMKYAMGESPHARSSHG